MKWHDIKSELIPVAVTWFLGAGIGQLILMPIVPPNGSLWFGIVIGATSQAANYICNNRLKDPA